MQGTQTSSEKRPALELPYCKGINTNALLTDGSIIYIGINHVYKNYRILILENNFVLLYIGHQQKIELFPPHEPLKCSTIRMPSSPVK